MNESNQSKRTRKLIMKSLLDLLLERDFDSISVTDICDRALITRATFYKYYEDKFHLISCALQDIKEQVFNDLDEKSCSTPKELYLKIIEAVIDYIEENQKRVLLFLKHSSSDKLKMIVFQQISDTIENLTIKEQKNFRFLIPPEIVSKFLAGGLTFLIGYMINNETHYTKKEMLAWTNDVLDGMLKN